MSAAGIWLTRPREDSLALHDILHARSISSLVAPVTEIERIHVPWPTNRPDAILLSSRHAAASLATVPEDWHDLPVYCVGAATAELARQYGMRHVLAGYDDMDALLPQLYRTQTDGDSILYPCGEDIRVDPKPLLRPHGITLECLVVYRATAVTQLSPTLVEAIRHQQVQGVVLFSPRTAMLTNQLLTAHDLGGALSNCALYCLSPNVAAAASALGGRIHTCPEPTLAAMVELLSAHAIRAA